VSGGNGANDLPATSAPPHADHDDSPETHEAPQADATLAQAIEERDRLQEEVARLTALRNELRSRYQALALAALDALAEDSPERASGKGDADGPRS
jgi:hypothetical protein